MIHSQKLNKANIRRAGRILIWLGSIILVYAGIIALPASVAFTVLDNLPSFGGPITIYEKYTTFAIAFGIPYLIGISILWFGMKIALGNRTANIITAIIVSLTVLISGAIYAVIIISQSFGADSRGGEAGSRLEAEMTGERRKLEVLISAPCRLGDFG